VRYPIVVDQTEAWRPVPPGGKDVRAVRLPAEGALHALERFVPAGWYISGGDPDAQGTLPRQRLWVDDFSLAVRPVTHQDYLRFLDALVAEGRADEAAARAARVEDRRTGETELLHTLHGRRYALSEEVVSIHLDRAAPVVGVSWFDAQAYCAWLGAQTGTAWRLPGELEREKAARGVDGRAYPWGAQADPAFHCMQDSPLTHPGAPSTAAFTVDRSPYGVMGLAGGVQEWCADAWKPEGPERRGSRALAPPPPGDKDLVPQRHGPRRVVRGGAWNLESHVGRCASRSASRPDRRAANLGFRICRSLDLG
jgi:formylglycine-generating enzyme required for sulfatase activity